MSGRAADRRRFLFAIDIFRPVICGPGMQVETIAQRLVRRGHQATVLTERRDPSWPVEEWSNGVRILRIPYPRVRRLGAAILFSRLAGKLVSLRRDYDVIHVQIVKYFAFVCTVVGEALGKPVYLKFSGWEELDRGVLNPAMLRRPVIRLLRQGTRRAHGFVCISSRIREAALRAGYDEARLIELANGVDTDRFAPASDPRESRRDLGLGEGPVAVFTGRLVPEKGLDVLIEAWQRALPGLPRAARLVIVGEGAEEPRLRGMVDRNGLGDSVRFAGFVADPERYLRAADLYVLPSLVEGLPNSLLEAMAVGLPSIVTRVGGNEDAVVDGACGRVVPARDAGALADALADLVNDPSRRRRWGAAARERVLERFSIEALVDAIETLGARDANATSDG